MKTEEIKDLENKISILKREIMLERKEHIKLFQKKIDNLIQTTPTGDLRNEITDLNILFNSIILTEL